MLRLQPDFLYVYHLKTVTTFYFWNSCPELEVFAIHSLFGVVKWIDKIWTNLSPKGSLKTNPPMSEVC